MTTFACNRLNLRERTELQEQLDLLCNDVSLDAHFKQEEFLEDKKVEIVRALMQRKRDRLNIARTRNRFIESDPQQQEQPQLSTVNSEDVNIEEIHVLLKHCELSTLTEALNAFKNERDKLVSALIGALYEGNGQFDALSREELECILFRYFKPVDLSTDNWIKMAQAVVGALGYEQLDIYEFAKIVRDRGIDGNVFTKGHPSFIKGVMFAKLFSSMTGFKEHSLRKKCIFIFRTIGLDTSSLID